MFKILLLLQRKLSWAVPVFMIAGFLTGVILPDVSFLKSLILPVTFLMVFPMMVTMQFRKITERGGAVLQSVTQLINFVVIPFIAFSLGRVFFADRPWLALGFLLVSLLPTSGMTISWTGMSGGNMEAAVKMTVFGLIMGSLLTPLYIKLLMGATVTIPTARIISQILVIVVLPMLLGALTQKRLIQKYGKEVWTEKIKKRFPPFSTLGVLTIVFIAMALKAKAVMADPVSFVGLIPPLLTLYLINMVLSTLIAKLFFNRADGLALVYGTVLRNLSIALAIAMTSFGKEGSGIALIIALGYIIQIQLSAWYVRISPLIFKEEPESRRTRFKNLKLHKALSRS